MKKEKIIVKEQTIQVEELITQQKRHIEALHAQTLREAEQLGEEDGTLNLPRTEDKVISPNERMIRHKYQKLIAECWHKGKPYLDAPHLAYRTLVEQLSDLKSNKSKRYKGALEIIEQKKKEETDFTVQEFMAKENEVMNYDKHVQRDFLLAKQGLQKIQDKVGRNHPIIHFKSTVLYLLLLIGIGICEVPLNLQIFQKFGEAFFITIIMAASLAIAIPVLAHFTGVFVKQRKEKKEYLLFAITCISLFVVFNFGISIFRAYVLAEHVGEDPNQLNIVIFTCLNLILFIIGLLAAYFRHDESYELEHHYEHYMEEKKAYDLEKKSIHGKLTAIRNERSHHIKAIQDKYLKEKAQLNNREADLVKERNVAIRSYDELLNSFVALEAYIDSAFQSAIEKYRAANLMHRQDHLSPTSWGNGMRQLDFKFSDCVELDPN